MKFPDLDTTDYNRTLASIGVALIVLGLIVPWLIFRDSSALEITSAELARLTPNARNTVEQRQQQIAFAQSIWPFFTLPLAAAGAIVLGWSVWRIRALQPHRDKVLIASGIKAEAEWKSQTAGEIVRSIEKDRGATDESDLEMFDELSSNANSQPPDVTSRLQVNPRLNHGTNPDRVELAVGTQVDLEDRVLDAIGEKLQPTHRIWKHPKLETESGGTLLDALIVSGDRDAVLAVVEVKTVISARSAEVLTESAMAQLLRINDKFRTEGQFPTISNGWIVLVYPDESRPAAEPARRFREIRDQVTKLDTGPAIVSAVRESELGEIEIPRDLVAPDRAVFEIRESEGPIPSPA